MKKILAAVAAVFMLAGSAFALEFAVDANFAMPLDFAKQVPVNSSTTNVGSIKTTVNSTDISIGFDAGARVMVTKMFGVKLDIGLTFPQSSSSKSVTDTNVFGSTSTSTSNSKTTYKDIYDSYTCFDIFVGPAIRVVKAAAYEVTVTPGFSIDMRSQKIKDSDSTSKSTRYGVGAEIEAHLNLMRNLYINAGCPLIYQFKVVDSNDNETKTSAFRMMPKIGIGFRM